MHALQQYPNRNGAVGRRQPPSLDLVDVHLDRVDFNLTDLDGYVRGVSAVVNAAGEVEFPHMHSDTGESLGDDAADLYVRRRAATELTRLRSAVRAARGWSR